MSERESITIKTQEAREIGEIDAKQVLRNARRALMAENLHTAEGVAGARAWRELDRGGRVKRAMRRFFDTLSAFNRAEKQNPSQRDKLEFELRARVVSARQAAQLTRIDELQNLFFAAKFGEAGGDVRPEVKKIFDGLRSARSREGEVNVAELLASDAVSYGVKTQWFESQLASALKFLERKDAREAERRAEEALRDELVEEKERAPDVTLPPPEQDSFQPSMEELERAKEGEASAYFTILPFYGGYWRENDFDVWNARLLQWERGARQMAPAREQEVDRPSRRVMAGTARGASRTSLPLPYGFVPDTTSLKTRGAGGIKILKDEKGGYALEGSGASVVPFTLEIGRGARELGGAPKTKLKIETGQLSPETEQVLEDVKKSKRLPLAAARMIKAYVRRTFKYSNDSSMNAVYRGRAEDYFKRLESGKAADCDVANTYFLALLSRLDIPARLVTGHYVKTKDNQGAAVISAGTGHAWTEVWDGMRWHRLDATPPGDPVMDEEETDEKEDSFFEGDFGEQEAQEISDEELEQMIEEAQQELARQEAAPEGRRAAVFAEAAGCGGEEAKQILRQIETARGLRDRKGRNIRSRIIKEFAQIVQKNLLQRLKYKAPVRMSQAHDLADPVEAMLDVRAGVADPTGFARYETEVLEEQIYGGMDVIFVADKSGSMSENDTASGASKWQEQQKFIFLYLDALHAAREEFRRQRIKLISPLDVRAALVSFQDGGAQVHLPLKSSWGPKEQYAVWKALQENVGGGTPDHLGLGAAQTMIEEDKAAEPRVKDRVRLVLVSADGGSDNKSATMAAKEALKGLGVVVKAAGIGPGAREVEATYYPDGKNLPGFEAAPDWAGEQVITEAKRLYPKQVLKEVRPGKKT